MSGKTTTEGRIEVLGIFRLKIPDETSLLENLNPLT
jgi:hypothetical protein